MTKGFWVAVNKNLNVVMFCDEPTKNENLGRWEGVPYINSYALDQILPILKQANFGFNDEPQFLSLELRSTDE